MWRPISRSAHFEAKVPLAILLSLGAEKRLSSSTSSACLRGSARRSSLLEWGGILDAEDIARSWAGN